MIGRRGAFGLLAGASLLLSGCDWLTAPAWPHVLRYRLTATVDTPAGERSGHSVIEVAMSRTSGTYKVQGEAVAVDLPNNETLFVLLRSETDVDWAAWALQVPANPEKDVVQTGDAQEKIERVARWAARLKADRGVYPLWTRGLSDDARAYSIPYFVRFKDIKDPKSVEQVDPDDLAKSFGKGYALKSLALQMTDEPVTSGIEKKLAWLKGMVSNLDGTQLYDVNADLSALLNSGDFRQGFKK